MENYIRNISPDFYNLAGYVDEVKKKYTAPVNEETLMIGLYGMIGELFSNTIQNSVVMASEFANESIPTKAKFEKNIIAHALNLNITSFNANPATMSCLLIFIEDEIIRAIGHDGTGEFILDCDNQIFFDKFEFHTDYDIIIKRIKLANGKYTYTAMYDIIGDNVYKNPISDITNPYLPPPIVINVIGTKYLFVSCTIRQVEKTKIYKKILDDNTIASKTTNFDFESQLAGFTVDVHNDVEDVHLVPVYEGLTNSNSYYNYIWYTYLDTNTIRIKFDRNSYSPRVNSDITINVLTTQGEEGNFKWASTDYPTFSFDSGKNHYSNITVQVRPNNGRSIYGTDKKSIKELRKIIAVEALARGSITNTKDLHNYFNSIDTDVSTMFLYKKRDNALERLYYSFIVMKDEFGNVIPTNTTNVFINPSMLIRDDRSNMLVLKKGQIFKLNRDGDYCVMFTPPELEDGEEFDYSDGFYYTIPYNLAISLSPVYGMYFISTMNTTKDLEFSWINEECQFQYIATHIDINRKYLTEKDTYKMTLEIEQNLLDDNTMIVIDKLNGQIIERNIKVYMVLYDKDDEPYRWIEGEFQDDLYNRESKISTFIFKVRTDDLIDSKNNIKIYDVNQVGMSDDGLDYGYFPSNSKAFIHIVTKQSEFSNKTTYVEFGEKVIDLRDYIPTIPDNWCVTNTYRIISGIDFFYDYTEIVYSTINTIKDPAFPGENDKYNYMIQNVPLIKYDYFKDENMIEYFCGELIRRKYYINEAIKRLEDNFGMNFKFFNTYGPARLFTLDNDERFINRVNLSLTFKLGLQVNYDENIIDFIIDDIKNYIDKIDTINSLHMSNLISHITCKYGDSLKFFEFVDMNGYGPGEQHIYKKPMPDKVITPELLNVNTLPDLKPDIKIIIV